MKLEDEVLAWFNSMRERKYPASEWVLASDGRAYIRHQIHGGKKLTIANIEIKKQQQGTFKELLRKTESFAKAHDYTVVVECIHNKHLHAFLLREGYQPEAHRDARTLLRSFHEQTV